MALLSVQYISVQACVAVKNTIVSTQYAFLFCTEKTSVSYKAETNSMTELMAGGKLTCKQISICFLLAESYETISHRLPYQTILKKFLKNKKTDAYNSEIAFNRIFVALASNIKNISENIKYDVITSKVASRPTLKHHNSHTQSFS